MTLYEYRCRECETRFEQRRPMDQADDPAVCPEGHTDTVRLLAAFSSVKSSAGSRMPEEPPCGGACMCQ